MRRISSIGNLLKKSYRLYSNELISLLSARGFTDLRPSFLEILIYICENEGTHIKNIGLSCGLKKQTMTSHLKELKKRGYVISKLGDKDKREQKIYLTEYGEKFRFNLYESISELEIKYTSKMGEVELARIEYILSEFLKMISDGNAHHAYEADSDDETPTATLPRPNHPPVTETRA